MKSISGQSRRQSSWVTSWKVCLPVILLVVLLSSLLFATPAAAALSISPYSLSDGQVGVIYPTTTLTVSGGTGPYIWSYSGTFPNGLNFTAGTGASATISGTPTLANVYHFSVTVIDTATSDTTTTNYTLTIAATPITFTTITLPTAKEGVSYQAYIAVAGGKSPYSFSLPSGTLPSGLTLDATNGIILGTPANGSAGTYTFSIGVTDSSTPTPLTAQRSYSLVVEAGYFEAVIKVSVSLSAGETSVYVDGILAGTLEGGETLTRSFDVDDELVITVDATVLSPTRSDIRFIADDDEIVVDKDNPDATFSYATEYYIDLKTDPAQITTLTGAGWFEVDDFIEATAPVLIEESTDTQYRFDYWLLPDGDEDVNEDLNWKVTSPGKATATYETYYLLTVTSTLIGGEASGGGWYKAGTAADWSVNPPEAPMSGLWGVLQGKLKPENATGTEVMDAPKTIDIAWNPDYTMPIIFIVLLVVVLGVVAFFVYRHFHPPVPKAAPVAAAPAPPTIVLIDGRLGPGTTKDQLVDQFKQLLDKYQDEVGGGVQGAGPPGARPVPEAQLLAAAKEEACGYTSKRLLRTVVGHWHKVEEEVIPPDEKKGIKTTSIRTVWGREIYKEWEVSVCSLPQGHVGNHHGATFKSYTLQDSVSEEKSYTPRQKTTPPKSHFTDELPLVAVAPNQIMPPDQNIAADEAAPDVETITPDEIIPPDEPTED